MILTNKDFGINLIELKEECILNQGFLWWLLFLLTLIIIGF